jgi:hypothetical protein
MELDLPSKLRRALEREAADARRTLHAHIVRKLEGVTPAIEFIKPEVISTGLPRLVTYLNRVPAVTVVSSDTTPDAFWWVKLDINMDHRLAWNVVQELGFVLNYISLQEKLPTVFMPVSPPPYLNGGPRENLSWVIESKFNYIDPAWIAEVLEDRLPQPVEDETKWEE